MANKIRNLFFYLKDAKRQWLRVKHIQRKKFWLFQKLENIYQPAICLQIIYIQKKQQKIKKKQEKKQKQNKNRYEIK